MTDISNDTNKKDKPAVAETEQSTPPNKKEELMRISVQSNRFAIALFIIVSIALFSNVRAQAADLANDEELAYSIGIQAYIYGYPMMDLYRTLYETSLDPKRGHDRTINEFFFFRRLVTHEDDWVVTPNEDTIYHRAFLDLRLEPIVLVIPEMGERHYWFPIGDMHHNFDGHLSWDTVGSRGGAFALCPPGWQGVLPDGVERVDVSTPIIWMIGRYAVDGVADIPAATALQDQTHLILLSKWGKGKTPQPEINVSDYPVFTRNDLTDATKYFTTLNELLRMTPRNLHPVDIATFGWFREINLHPSQQFDMKSLSPESQRGLERAAAEGHRIISERQKRFVPIVNNWQLARLDPDMSDEFLISAGAAMLGLLFNPKEVSTYDVTFFDGNGQVLDGTNSYTLHLDPPPPVNAFWSLSMYSGETRLFVQSPINRYSIGNRTEGLIYGEDGSLSITMQHEEPTDPIQRSNWLPAPKGPFYLVLRHYSPQAPIINGDWLPNAIEKK